MTSRFALAVLRTRVSMARYVVAIERSGTYMTPADRAAARRIAAELPALERLLAASEATVVALP